MFDRIPTELFVLTVFFGILVSLEFGLYLGRRAIARGAKEEKGFAALEGALFALLGLLVAFTFSGAASRFDSRRMLISEEANDIGTAYLRLDLLPPGLQPELRELFRRYTDSRLAVYKKLPDLDAARAELARSVDLQNQIWAKSVAAVQTPGTIASAPMLLIPAVNQMIDITGTRTMSALIHPPIIIYLLLLLLTLACSVLSGRAAAPTGRSWLHIIGFAVVMSLTCYMILDVEYPRAGLIRIDAYDQFIVDVRNSMK
jgi:hypothetical protein